MELMLSSAAAGDVRVVAYGDLDGFKSINDVALHGTGDEVLRAVARRIDAAIDADDAVYRVGGDEFVIISRNPDTAPDELEQRLRDAVDQDPITVEGAEFEVSMTVGAVLVPAGGDPARAISAADAAMYGAKAKRHS
jgi:diguanylate cyclase (GGDEF)-like protein